MDTGLILDIFLFVAALSALCYWVFVAPIRARRRRQRLLGECGGRGAAWPRGVYDGRRNR